MNGSLSIPLYIIAEEKKVASISRNYEEIIDVFFLLFRHLKTHDLHEWLITKKLKLSSTRQSR
jgi:hypothetical protein